MPPEAWMPISPYRPSSLSKRVNKVEFPDTIFTLAANSELEIICYDGYINSPTSEHIALFIQYNSAFTNVIQPRLAAHKRTLTNKPATTDIGTAYIGGYLRFTGGTGSFTMEHRFYEPLSFANPSDYSNIYNNGTNMIKYPPNSLANNSIHLNCMPVDLRTKRFANIASSDFHKLCHHVKIKNTGASAGTVSVYGAWWLETNEPTYGGVAYYADLKCPHKLAEYVIGNLRNKILTWDSTTSTAMFNQLDNTITTAVEEVTQPWKALVISLDDETTEEADWSTEQIISNN